MFFRLAAFLTVLVALYAGYEAYRVYLADTVSVWLAPTPSVMDYALGNPEGDVTVIEYLDYSCPYCREMDPVLRAAVEQDGNVRHIPRPLMSYNADGSTAARIFYTAAQVGKYEQAHRFLMTDPGPLDSANLPRVAEALGIEFNRFADIYSDPSLLKALEKNYNDFAEAGGTATPTLIINGTKFVPEGEMPSDADLIALFQQERGS